MNKIFVIAGPSGVGKDTIINAMLKKFPDLVKAISYTDRDRRADDPQNAYYFISKDKFDELIKTGEIFEWEYARDERRYGSSKKEIQESLKAGKNNIKIVGPKSFANFKNIFGPQAIGIFVKFEDIGILKERIKKNRPDTSDEDIEIRYNQAFRDMAFEKDYNYSVVNKEGHVDKAIAEVEDIIKKELSA